MRSALLLLVLLLFSSCMDEHSFKSALEIKNYDKALSILRDVNNQSDSAMLRKLCGQLASKVAPTRDSLAENFNIIAAANSYCNYTVLGGEDISRFLESPTLNISNLNETYLNNFEKLSKANNVKTGCGSSFNQISALYKSINLGVVHAKNRGSLNDVSIEAAQKMGQEAGYAFSELGLKSVGKHIFIFFVVNKKGISNDLSNLITLEWVEITSATKDTNGCYVPIHVASTDAESHVNNKFENLKIFWSAYDSVISKGIQPIGNEYSLTDWMSKNNPCTSNDDFKKFDLSIVNDSVCVAVLKNPNEFYEKVNPEVLSNGSTIINGSIITKAKYITEKKDYSESVFNYVLYSVANAHGDLTVYVKQYKRELFGDGEYKWEYCNDCDEIRNIYLNAP